MHKILLSWLDCEMPPPRIHLRDGRKFCECSTSYAGDCSRSITEKWCSGGSVLQLAVRVNILIRGVTVGRHAMNKGAVNTVLSFVDRINHHDVSGLVALMAEDHLFIDALGQEVCGRQQMGQGWRGYFALFPDYSIKLDTILSDGTVVGLFGTAQGTYSGEGNMPAENHWEIPAAWKAVVRSNRVAEWRVYADNEPVWKIMGVKRY